MIGNLLRLVGSDLACNDLIPFRTPSSFGILGMAGSGSLAAICKWRTAEM